MLFLRRAAAVCLTAWLTVAVLCTAAAADETESSAAEPTTYECGSYTYSILVGVQDESKKAACIESYKGTDETLVIPDELDGLKVVALGDRAFLENHALTEVTLPDSLIGIGTYTFASCINLKAFRTGENAEYFHAADGILFAEEGKYLVRYPIGLMPASYTVPDGVYDIGTSCFADCITLTSVTLPDSVTAIGASAFAGCNRLTEITLPDEITEIEPHTFYRCSELKTVKLSKKLETIGDFAFSATAIETIALPESLKTIGECCFADTKMTEVMIPSTVTEIGQASFGWKLDSQNTLVMDNTFTIRGYKNSAAETYSNDYDLGNSFVFVALDQPAESAAPVSEEEKQGLGIGRIIGAAVCGAAILAIIGYGIISGVRGRKCKAKKASEEKETDE